MTVHSVTTNGKQLVQLTSVDFSLQKEQPQMMTDLHLRRLLGRLAAKTKDNTVSTSPFSLPGQVTV